MNSEDIVQSIVWRDDHARLIDQTYLPRRTVFLDVRDVGRMWEAIRSLRVRGAPAIGIAAAYGFYLGIKDATESSYESFQLEAARVAEYLESSRPTAVNLSWAMKRLLHTLHAHKDKPVSELKLLALKTAITIHEEDKRTCKKIGEFGQSLISSKMNILTHCNTGSLATGKFGTALSVIYHAHMKGKKIHVWVDETRPLLQGARLTAWELQKAEIPMKLITDSMAGYLMQAGKVDIILVGADRVAANGDTANKIGTYTLAVLAEKHNIPFYVAVPLSTFDITLESGKEIPIEERDAKEVLRFGDAEVAPPKTDVFNPAFDVTPGGLITGFITERGIISPDYKTTIAKLFEG